VHKLLLPKWKYKQSFASDPKKLLDFTIPKPEGKTGKDSPDSR
jgi:hypothetical protein